MIGSVDCRPNKLWKGMCMLPCTLAKRTSDSVSQRPVLWGHFTQQNPLQPGQFHQFHSPKHSPPFTHLQPAHLPQASDSFPISQGTQGESRCGFVGCGISGPWQTQFSIWEAASIQQNPLHKTPRLKLRFSTPVFKWKGILSYTTI